MAWHEFGAKPVSEAVMKLLTISQSVVGQEWVNKLVGCTFEIDFSWKAPYGSGHETAAVLLPGFAINW